jgi:hypothetical protein
VNALVEQARERTLLLEIAVGCPIVAGAQPGTSPPFSTVSVNEKSTDLVPLSELAAFLVPRSQCCRLPQRQLAAAADIPDHEQDAFIVAEHEPVEAFY